MSPEQHDHFCKWLRKNGIDPNHIPRYTRIICHGNRITYKKFKVRQNRRGGKLLMLDSRWMTTWDTKTTRIRVPFEAIK